MKTQVFLLALFGLIVASGAAYAQSLSGRGGSDQVTNKSCETEVVLVSDGIATLRAKIEKILACGAKYKLYTDNASDPDADADGCIPAKYPTYQFTDVGTEYHISFEGEQVGDHFADYNVRGPKGANGVDADINGCGVGYTGSYQ